MRVWPHQLLDLGVLLCGGRSEGGSGDSRFAGGELTENHLSSGDVGLLGVDPLEVGSTPRRLSAHVSCGLLEGLPVFTSASHTHEINMHIHDRPIAKVTPMRSFVYGAKGQP